MCYCIKKNYLLISVLCLKCTKKFVIGKLTQLKKAQVVPASLKKGRLGFYFAGNFY